MQTLLMTFFILGQAFYLATFAETNFSSLLRNFQCKQNIIHSTHSSIGLFTVTRAAQNTSPIRKHQTPANSNSIVND